MYYIISVGHVPASPWLAPVHSISPLHQPSRVTLLKCAKQGKPCCSQPPARYLAAIVFRLQATGCSAVSKPIDPTAPQRPLLQQQPSASGLSQRLVTATTPHQLITDCSYKKQQRSSQQPAAAARSALIQCSNKTKHSKEFAGRGLCGTGRARAASPLSRSSMHLVDGRRSRMCSWGWNARPPFRRAHCRAPSHVLPPLLALSLP